MAGLAGLLAAVLAGLGGLLVPALIARVPEPAGAPEPGDPAKETYAAIAATPGLGARAAVVSALAGGLVGAWVGWRVPLVGLVPLVPVCVALAVIDWRTRLLPRLVVLPATGALLVLVVLDALVLGEPSDLVRPLAGLVAARSFFWVLWRVHSAGMGFGDVRLAALVGLALGWLGWAELVVGMYAGFVLFAVPGLLVALVRRDRRVLRRAAPYGPFLVAGALAGVLVGPLVLPGLASG
ncbi:prepilin peptidase [Nocardioides sp. dk4132]|uniref:prepilin peptidase n=1 Tax=unclassified Nocardioides TaxID=2615069 RepID=UPI0012953C0D|nr:MULTISPECIES: A24 family peptidase [unclassified Nocardioides]MQW74934.1 prepilin peptidase [Nocardioides sp. dk4132]QGA07878.1 prepilin peptidase [Nocardioides sp. dk884]